MKTSTLILVLALVGCGSNPVETPWTGSYEGSLRTQMQGSPNPDVADTTEAFTLFVDSYQGSTYVKTDFGCTLVFVPKSDTEAVALPVSCSVKGTWTTQDWAFSSATMTRVNGKVTFKAEAVLTFSDGSAPVTATYTFTETK